MLQLVLKVFLNYKFLGTTLPDKNKLPKQNKKLIFPNMIAIPAEKSLFIVVENNINTNNNNGTQKSNVQVKQ